MKHCFQTLNVKTPWKFIIEENGGMLFEYLPSLLLLYTQMINCPATTYYFNCDGIIIVQKTTPTLEDQM